MTKAIKYLLVLMVTPVVAMVLMVPRQAIKDRQIDYDVDLNGTAAPTFRELVLPFTNSNDGETSLPFLACTVIILPVGWYSRIASRQPD